MRKLIILSFGFLSVILPQFAGAVCTTTSTAFTVGTSAETGGIIFAGTGGDSQRQVDQSFSLATSTNNVCAITIRLKKEGTPTNNVIIGIRSSENGSNLAQAIINGAGLTTNYTNYNLDLDTKIALSASTNYWVNMHVDANRSETNRYLAAQNTDYSGGYMSYTNDDINWISDTPNDMAQLTIYYDSSGGSSSTSTSTSTCYTGLCMFSTSTDAALGNIFKMSEILITFGLVLLIGSIVYKFVNRNKK